MTEQEKNTVLLWKRLSYSDLADTVLQTGRIVLPRNQMEIYAQKIIDMANTGARNVNTENSKATYELTVTDNTGKEWQLLLKQWTANASQSPRPIYVLERTSACMKAHRATPGCILELYYSQSDPATLRITVLSAQGGQKTAETTVAATTVPPPPPPQQQQQQHPHPQRSNLDLLLSIATAYDTTPAPIINTGVVIPSISTNNTNQAAINQPNTAINVPDIVGASIDYLARHEGRHSPADALNLAALQMQQKQQQQHQSLNSDFTRSRGSREAVNRPTSLQNFNFNGGSTTATTAAAGRNNNTAVNNPLLTSPSSSIIHRRNTTKDTTIGSIDKEVCPTWIVINYKNLRGDLHIPSMMVSLVSSRGKKSTELSDVDAPMSIHAWQLLALTMHRDTNSARHFHESDFVNLGDGTAMERAAAAAAAAAAREGDTITVEGAGMSLQRWLKSWDLPFMVNAGSPQNNDSLGLAPAPGGGNGGCDGSGSLGAIKAKQQLQKLQQQQHPKRQQQQQQQQMLRNSSSAVLASGRIAEDASTDSDVEAEAGEVLLAMMGVIESGDGGCSGGSRGGGSRRGKKRKQPEQQSEPKQQQLPHQQEEPASTLFKPQATLITPTAASMLYINLINEKLQAAESAAAATQTMFAASAPAFTASTALQLQLRHEATLRGHTRLDHLSKRANLAKMLSALSQINYPPAAAQY